MEPDPTLHRGDEDRALRRLQVTASRLATAIFAGEYRSAFRGRGIEFDEVREYQPGDDVRSIDWNVTARQRRTFVKRFIEERELTLVMLLDRSASMEFGTVRCTKLRAAVEACSILAFAALRSHDRISLITYGDGQLRYLPPGKGKRHALRLIREAVAPPLAAESPQGLPEALDHLKRVLKAGSLSFIFSDFHEPLPLRHLAAVAAAHDTVAVAITDPLERELPPAGLLRLIDPETGRVGMVDAGSANVRSRYREAADERRLRLKKETASAGADLLELGTETSPLHPFMEFFSNRTRGKARW